MKAIKMWTPSNIWTNLHDFMMTLKDSFKKVQGIPQGIPRDELEVEIQGNLTRNESVAAIPYLTDMIRNQQNEEHDTP